MKLIQQPPFMLRWAYPGAVWRLNKKSKTVYLTFDDGPITDVTPWVLDVLDRENVKATFFCVGENVEKHKQIYNNILNRGHSVGNHSFHHIRGREFSLNEYLKDVEKASNVISSKLFRPPYGSLTISQFKSLRKNYRIVFWDVLTEDYNPRKSANDCLNNVKQLTRNGSVIVFHDSIKAAERLKNFLPAAIQHLKQQGYAFGLIGEK
jgi:peptidoglycan/xylan/chitin deacetylase (PgdA/CDA1 family)